MQQGAQLSDVELGETEGAEQASAPPSSNETAIAAKSDDAAVTLPEGRIAGTIPVQWFFNLFLLFVVAVPLTIVGYMAVQRGSDTAFNEVQRGNQRAATAIAGTLSEYVEGERKLLQAMGEASVQMRDASAHEAVLDSFLVKNRHITRAAVYNRDGVLVAGSAGLENGLETALKDKTATIIAKENNVGGLSIGQIVYWTEPLWVAGEFGGAIAAEVELVGLWEPVGLIRVGRTGFVRLITADGKLLAHGKSEERRKVFSASHSSADPKLLEAAKNGGRYVTADGDDLIVAAAKVGEIDSYVVIEQSSSEALGSVVEMKEWLYFFCGGALFVALMFGLYLTRRVVKPIESLSRHVRVLANGDLRKRIDGAALSRLSEVRGLASSVDEMAEALDSLQQEKIGRERLSTFARVAAGLAHDIRHPIESVRGACIEYLAHPEDEIIKGMFRDVTEVDLPKLKKFVEDLQGLAKTGSLAVDRIEVDAFDLANEAVEEIKIAPKWRSLVNFTTLGDVEAEISVDPSLFKRALGNLMHNAGEACMGNGRLNKGGLGQVSVGVEVVESGSTVAFRVTDTGCGIEKERLVDLLSSEFKSTKRSTGVGLGLGVVRQVAESHGGRLAVASTLGEGSTFTLFLPRVGAKLDASMLSKTDRGVGPGHHKK